MTKKSPDEGHSSPSCLGFPGGSGVKIPEAAPATARATAALEPIRTVSTPKKERISSSPKVDEIQMGN
eukprot:scaffold643180_cov41-Prasinocladus_malaysianus.AAC.1